MDLGLKDKVAIVTGGASAKGIGSAIARVLAIEGVKVVVTDIAAEGIATLAAELRATGHVAMAMPADQSVYEQVHAVVQTARGEFGRVDILVNCAAQTDNLGSITSMALEKWRRELDISLSGPYYWIREVVPLMKEHQWGRIINISSVTSLFGGIGVPAYVTSKGGLNTLTKQVARDYARNGITANCLVLGAIATEVYEKSVYDDDIVQKMISRIPMGRMGARAEVADVAAFLCSERASYLTGDLIVVDGAISLSI